MTPEQISLEFEHMLIDQQEKNGNKQVYVDDDYERYDEESESRDNRLSDMPAAMGAEASDPGAGMVKYLEEQKKLPKKEQIADDWEDVEIDDFDDE